MRKIKPLNIALLIAAFLLLITLSSCNVKKNYKIYYKLYTNSNYDNTEYDSKVQDYNDIRIIYDRDDYYFDGWYLDNTFSTEFNSESKIYDNLTLYGRWVGKIQDEYFVYSVNDENELTVIDVTHNTDTLTIPETFFNRPITRIDNNAFYYSSDLEHLTLQDNLKSFIYDITHLRNLRTLNIGKNLNIEIKYLHGINSDLLLDIANLNKNSDEYNLLIINSFLDRLKNLESITVSQENDKLYSLDGVLFSKTNSSLICYPSEKRGATYTIPEGTVQFFDNYYSDTTKNLYLSTLIIPSSLSSFKYYSFNKFSRLENIIIDEDNNCFKFINGALYTFNEKRLLSYLHINTETSFYLPEGIESIGEYAFYSNNTLINLYLPSSVNVEENIFSSMSKLEKFIVDPSNAYLKSIDDVLFSKDEKMLIAYPSNKSGTIYTVPNSVEIVCDKAFKNTKKLKIINFPEDFNN